MLLVETIGENSYKLIVNEKRSLMPWGLRVPIWKMNLCSRFLRLSVVPWCRERPQIDMCSLEWLGRLKCGATGFDASLSSFSTSRRPGVLGIDRLVVFLFRQCIPFCLMCRLCYKITFAEVHVKRSVILTEEASRGIRSYCSSCARIYLLLILHSGEGYCCIDRWRKISIGFEITHTQLENELDQT